MVVVGWRGFGPDVTHFTQNEWRNVMNSHLFEVLKALCRFLSNKIHRGYNIHLEMVPSNRSHELLSVKKSRVKKSKGSPTGLYFLYH